MPIPVPWTTARWRRCVWAIDARRAGEVAVLVCSLAFAVGKIAGAGADVGIVPQANARAARELGALLLVALIYLVRRYGAVEPLHATGITLSGRPATPPTKRRLDAEGDDKDEGRAFIWMSVPKNYRPAPDDGLLTALLLGPLVAAALLLTSLSSLAHPEYGSALYPPGDPTSPLSVPLGAKGRDPLWPLTLPSYSLHAHPLPITPEIALLYGRYALVDLATLTSTLLLMHVGASGWLEGRARRLAGGLGNGSASTATDERTSVPRSEPLRGLLFLAFAGGLSGVVWVVRVRVGIWAYLTPLDTIAAAWFYQLTLYVALRMAHRALTLGELGLVCFGGAAVFVEGWGVGIGGIWPLSTPYLKTFRLPTPLLVFQTALVGGPFLVGFLLAPLLMPARRRRRVPPSALASSNTHSSAPPPSAPPPSSRPSSTASRRRVLTPQEAALRTRRRLALALLLFSVLIILLPLGLWTAWALRGRCPWGWAGRWVFGRRRRFALLAWWSVLGAVSGAGWVRQGRRARRWRGEGLGALNTGLGLGMNGGGIGLGGGGAGMMGNGDASPTSTLFAASGELLDRAPTLGLNARRKFFHALVVVMFVPGVALDPAFTHLAVSVAFALFVFAEYIRYFAIYPLGAAVHLFMSEFLDAKDGGTAVLSHFYLLTGVAGALWLEGPSRLLQYTGILVLGIGDALASIVGKRHGRHAWSPTTSKTLEGSAAFGVTVVASAWALRVCGLVEPFSTWRYVLVVALAAVLEALSDQNDNLTLPLYTWSALVLAGVSPALRLA
ncbi:hypothetical protein DFH07DRAFT_1006356 [Mycena maculata]|uniref:dolichol kinase n=1 Tax=Mycena maculata TaxID=230809 RepID=A0AAD7ML82_9AGAR|nr:hypothetical protein DFH07DRAFT_1006356 [Mycena maculata]